MNDLIGQSAVYHFYVFVLFHYLIYFAHRVFNTPVILLNKCQPKIIIIIIIIYFITYEQPS